MIENSIQTSLINKNIKSLKDMQHKLLVNNKQNKIIKEIVDNLRRCDKFKISVAFITKSGVSLLKVVLQELEEKNIKGEILTGDYLLFTDPEALRELNEYKNIEIKMLRGGSLHTKGFFFNIENTWNIIVGSSNLTQNALTKNQEWNIKLSSRSEGKIVEEVMEQYSILWNRALLYNTFINDYTNEYNYEKEEKKAYLNLIKDTDRIHKRVVEICPNIMQQKTLDSLKNLRNNKKDKGLVVSATGTGKTYLAAFDVKQYNPNKMLFIVHRENIAKRAMKSFEKIIPSKVMGLYTGNQKDDADFLFCTIQTLHNNLESFSKEEFDYIIIDEVHHGGAKTYQKVVKYFTPKFLLGLSATPNRSDNFNIFEMFDFNIAAEIGLTQAYEHDLLTPFHYFGVSEIKVENKLIDENFTITSLALDQRVENIINKIKYYGHDGVKTKGLMFVSKIEEARELSVSLNKKGLKTKALDARDSEQTREEAIKGLEAGDLEYLITVNIFNEGVDIPCVNQIILLRPTESAIVYIQQLGRGLRKYENKEYVTIIDFIGNYKKNFLIPIALTEDGTYNKDILKDNVINNCLNLLEGACTMQFEEIAKQCILNNIKQENFSKLENIKIDYKYLKKKLNKEPTLVDFYTNKLINPQIILKYKKTYVQAKQKITKSDIYIELINNDELLLFIKYISQQITPTKRIEDIAVLKLLLHTSKTLSEKDIYDELVNSGYNINKSKLHNAILHLNKQIYTSLSKLKEYDELIVKEGDKYKINNKFKEGYKTNELFKEEIDDLLTLNELIYNDNYKGQEELAIIGEYYTKEEAFKYLLFDFNNGYQVGGYTVFKELKKVIIFITLSGKTSFEGYDNIIFSSNVFKWFSTKNRTLTNKAGEVTNEGLIAQNYFNIEVFIKKEDNEKYKYNGKVKEVLEAKNSKDKEGNNVVEYILELEHEILI